MGYFDENKSDIEVLLNGKIIALHSTSTSTYDDENNVLKINLTDGISNWNEIHHSAINYSVEKTLYDVMQDIFRKCYKNNNLLLSDIISNLSDTIVYGVSSQEYKYDNNISANLYETSIMTYLTSIKIPKFTLQEGDLETSLNKILAVAQLCCCVGYQGSQYDIRLYSARPLATKEEKKSSNIIYIMPQKQSTKFEQDIIPLNKYRDIRFEGSGISFVEG
ncbi:MAG: hypothetical protein KBS91_03950 [Firmicutes bacterium]|nr:hypothetical protein [Candidatus Caballimonas caccae]